MYTGTWAVKIADVVEGWGFRMTYILSLNRPRVESRVSVYKEISDYRDGKDVQSWNKGPISKNVHDNIALSDTTLVVMGLRGGTSFQRKKAENGALDVAK